MNDNDVDFKKEKVSKSKSRNTQYSSTKVKARNLLTNVGYRRFKDSDHLDLNFILDILSFLLQNFNPIKIDRKVDTEDEQLMINFYGKFVFLMNSQLKFTNRRIIKFLLIQN